MAISIVSSPWAVLDHNNPGGIGEQVPMVFVVEAVVTNTGSVAANDVVISLNYQEDPGNNWVLLSGEDTERTVVQLAPNEAYHAYWFARYSTVIGASHQYTVSAFADNASPVSTSNNAYGNPETGKTVKTRSALSTGNSGITQVAADIIVGVAFTMTIHYDLGTNPRDLILSPAGNPDFNPGAYRLIATKVRLYNDSGSQTSTIHNRLYFPTLPSFAENAEATYTFIALTTENVRVCSYAAVAYSTRDKYDQFFCDADKGTIIDIQGTLTMDLNKRASSATIQQDQNLAYTLKYTNTGTLPLSYVWIWDEVESDKGTIITSTISPPSDPEETTDGIVAWDSGTVPSSGNPGSTGTLSFSFKVDGKGQDLADGTILVNQAFFGINQGSLPQAAALTSTVTSTIQAPTISITKSDSRFFVEQGDTLTYALRITNTGSINATNIVVTDVLPANVSLAGAPTPTPTSQNGQTLVWNFTSIASGGGTETISIPARVKMKTPNGTVLANAATVKYENSAGHIYVPKVASDATTVRSPVLMISKSDFPDPVLTGRLITYTLSYSNNGPAQATNVIITDRVPISTTYQICSGGLTCVMSSGVVSWTVGTLPSSGSGTVKFSVIASLDLHTGDLVYNNDYGIRADQTNYVSGTAVTTEANRNAAFFDGYAFVDADGDGEFDGGEGTLSGITLSLLQALQPVTVTNGGGYYHFRVETAGPVSVTTSLSLGYFRTTPGTIYEEAILGITKTVNFGYAPLTSAFGIIYGTVYEDGNHDGVQNLGEAGIQGVTITSDEAVISPETTNALGGYTLRYSLPGSVTITEMNKPYYVSTTPDVVYTSVVTGSSNSSPIDFGDFLGIKISGMVFEDTDVDGEKDSGEGGLSGAIVAANGDSITTGGSGNFALYTFVDDSNPIEITETDPVGYASTDATPGSGMSWVDASTLQIDNPLSGTVYTGAYFGDVLAMGVITVSGYVWNDNGGGGGVMANGLRDGSEPGLAGAVVSLSSGLNQTTGSSGAFTLYAPSNQAITVTEINPIGYVSTNAIPGDDASKYDNDTILISPLASGSSSIDNLFGDVLSSGVAVITGTVFDDQDENSLFDIGESGIPGVTVTLEISGGISVLVHSNSVGQYQFAVTPDIDIRITSSGPANGYYPTTPESYVLRPPSSGVYPDNNFGYSDDTDAAVVFGIVFDDLNSDGIQDYGELGLAGAVLTLDDGSVMSDTTGSDGIFWFNLTESDIYQLDETNPPGYRSTTPDSLNISVELGNSYFVEFGDTNYTTFASLFGVVFEDQNGNGWQDANEIGLAGVVISVTVGGGVLTTTTKSYGQFNYGFDIYEAGYHTVSEADPALPGYHSTTPDEVVVYVELDNSYTVDFGDTLSSGFSTIMGTVFNDTSGDGLQNPSELGIEGVVVSVSNGMTTTTDEYGGYTFVITDTGIILVTETDPPGYHSTTPNTVLVNVGALGIVYQVNYGDNNNPSLSSFFGTVFEDLDAGGGRDLGEPGLSRVMLSFTNGSESYFTNEWGQYTFVIEALGTYTTTEIDPVGYVSTNAIPGAAEVTKIDNNTLQVQVSSLGVDFSDNLFGDVLATGVITVSGYVWNDNGSGGGTAGDGLQNGSEAGLAGAGINLSSGLSQTTDGDGVYLLYAPPDTVITVTETNPSGYVSTNAIPGGSASKNDNDTLVVSGLSGGSTSAGNLFGDIMPADLSIDKEDDPDLVVAGATLTYTLDYVNDGPSYAQDMFITDTLPSTVDFDSVVSQPPAFSGPSQNGQMLTWYASSLLDGAFGSIIFNVTVKSEVAAGTLITNQVSITSNMPDLDSGDNDANESTSVTTETDLEVSKGDEPDPVAAGATLTYTLSFSNEGPSDAQMVRITDTLPAEVVFDSVVSVDPAIFTFSQVDDQLVWEADSLAASDSGTIIFRVTVKPDAMGLVENNVEITSATPETEPDDNQSSSETAIGSPDQATIYGYVFEDVDGDGEKVLGESGIASVTITLDGVYTTSTDANGLYYFLTSITGTHIVEETDMMGYFSTTPNEVHLEVSVGESYRVDFGDEIEDAEFATIYGTVFHDKDKDGIWDNSELGITGVVLALDGTITTTTNQYGGYTLSTISAGSHEVAETDPPGYASTTPNYIQVNVSMSQGYEVDFGDILLCTCECDSYEEDENPASDKLIGMGVGNLQTRNFCDDDVDWVAFMAGRGDVYTITTSSWGQRADTFLELYDRDGVTLLAATDDYADATDYSSRIVWEAPTNGTYYIRVLNRAMLTGCQTDYDLWMEWYDRTYSFLPILLAASSGTVSAGEVDPTDVMHVAFGMTTTNLEVALGPLSPEGVITHTCPDVYEVDDTWQQASGTVYDVEQVHSFDSNPAEYAADKDFQWFYLAAQQTITFTVTTVRNTTTLLELYDRYGNGLNVTGATQLVYTSPKRAIYYLGISPQMQNFGCASTVGYDLLAERETILEVFLPILFR